MSEIKQYRVRNTRNGVELLRLYNAQEGWKTIKKEGFDNHTLFTGMTLAVVDGELKISPAHNSEGDKG